MDTEEQFAALSEVKRRTEELNRALRIASCLGVIVVARVNSSEMCIPMTESPVVLSQVDTSEYQILSGGE